MYTIPLSVEDTKRYRSAYNWRKAFQAEADQQMASRLEAVEIVDADGVRLYRSSQYRGADYDLLILDENATQ
jgi:UDP-N-acetyl-D-mannosaminuronic acid transferase (WecB/TagA/CpsF family)